MQSHKQVNCSVWLWTVLLLQTDQVSIHVYKAALAFLSTISVTHRKPAHHFQQGQPLSTSLLLFVPQKSKGISQTSCEFASARAARLHAPIAKQGSISTGSLALNPERKFATKVTTKVTSNSPALHTMIPKLLLHWATEITTWQLSFNEHNFGKFVII